MDVALGVVSEVVSGAAMRIAFGACLYNGHIAFALRLLEAITVCLGCVCIASRLHFAFAFVCS